jgi:hypothetical protein
MKLHQIIAIAAFGLSAVNSLPAESPNAIDTAEQLSDSSPLLHNSLEKADKKILLDHNPIAHLMLADIEEKKEIGGDGLEVVLNCSSMEAFNDSAQALLRTSKNKLEFAKNLDIIEKHWYAARKGDLDFPYYNAGERPYITLSYDLLDWGSYIYSWQHAIMYPIYDEIRNGWELAVKKDDLKNEDDESVKDFGSGLEYDEKEEKENGENDEKEGKDNGWWRWLMELKS